MSTVTDRSLYAPAAVAGFGAAAVLLVNAAKRAELIPTTALTQLVAPLAQVMALAIVTALYAAFGRRAGLFGTIAYAVNAVALALLVGVEFVINLVFAELPAATITELRAGPLGIALTIASLLFLVGSLMFVASLAVTRAVPRAPLALYALGAIPVSLRAFVPEAALQIGVVMLAVAIGWLSLSLLNHATKTAPQPLTV